MSRSNQTIPCNPSVLQTGPEMGTIGLPPVREVIDASLRPIGTAFVRIRRLAAESLGRLINANDHPDQRWDRIASSMWFLHNELCPDYPTVRPASPTPEADRFQISDYYFGIVRLAESADPIGTIAATAVGALARALPYASHVGSTLSELERYALLSPLEWIAQETSDAAKALTGRVAAPVSSHAMQSTGLAADTDGPLARWRYGHHLFVAIDQMMAVGITRLSNHMSKRNLTAAADNLVVLSDLMHASAVSLRLAADFAPGVYERIVVPHMTAYWPPMSGINLKDHGSDLKAIKCMCLGDSVGTGNSTFDTAHRRFLRARTFWVDAHYHACRNATGGTRPSLQDKSTSHDTSQKSAAEKLATDFGPARLRQAGCPFTGRENRAGA